MKKTIIALLVLGSVASAVEVTEKFQFTAPQSTVTLTNTYDLSKNWTLTFTCIATPSIASSENGTSIISSETDVTASWQKIQLNGKKDGVTAVVNAGNQGDGYAATVTGWSDTYMAPMMGSEAAKTYTLSYNAEAKTVTFSISDLLATQTFSGITYTSEHTLTQLTTGITQEQLNSTGTMMGMSFPQWSLPSGSFTGSIVESGAPSTPAIPEPTTATLSLLALAGLAARRRRK